MKKEEELNWMLSQSNLVFFGRHSLSLSLSIWPTFASLKLAFKLLACACERACFAFKGGSALLPFHCTCCWANAGCVCAYLRVGRLGRDERYATSSLARSLANCQRLGRLAPVCARQRQQQPALYILPSEGARTSLRALLDAATVVVVFV